MRAVLTLLVLCAGCGGGRVAADAGAAPAGDGGAWAAADGGVVAEPDAGTPPGRDGGPPACPPGVVCVNAFPFHHEADTSLSAQRSFSSYRCAPRTNEGGPEIVYRVVVAAAGLLGARVTDGDFTDVDLHLLSDLDPESCRARDDAAFSAYLEPGIYWIVADTWVDAGNVERVGSYALDLTFTPVPEIRCDMRSEPLPRVQGDVLQLPATGMVVLEAHLVTTAETFDGEWPSSGLDGIARHYALSERASGYVMRRTQPWAPQGEGGSMWGQGSTVKPPPLDEAWYVNMYWRDRPARGTRMLVRQPDGGLAVVASAGYETGPGSATAIGGATEEIHDFLGTTHRSILTMGFAVDQALPLGPVRCAP